MNQIIHLNTVNSIIHAWTIISFKSHYLPAFYSWDITKRTWKTILFDPYWSFTTFSSIFKRYSSKSSKNIYIYFFLSKWITHSANKNKNLQKQFLKRCNKTMAKQIQILNKFGMLRQHRWHIITKEMVLRNQKA